MIKRVVKFLMAFALFSSAMIYSQGEITTAGGTFNESVPAGTTDFSSLLMRARMSGNTMLNFTSSDPASIQAIQQQAAQMGITVNIISPRDGTSSSNPAQTQKNRRFKHDRSTYQR
jgi:ABC-type branched-subunit amino acid transport system substrate-binding protein